MKRRTFIGKASLGLPLATGFFCKDDLPRSEHQVLHLPDQLREQVFNIRAQPALWRRLGESEVDRRFWKHAYALYIDNGESLTSTRVFHVTEKFYLPEISFRDFRSRWNPQTSNDLLLACEVHHMYICWWRDRFGNALSGATWDDPISSWPRFKPLPIVDALLADSRGVLIWVNQIEALCDLFKPQRSSAHTFRVYVAKKRAEAFKAEAFKEATDMIFPDGRSLADIVQERMIFGIMKHLNARSASILMPHLSGRGESGRWA